MEYFYLLIAIAVIILAFLLIHLRPLTEREMEILSFKRRTQAINKYFIFDQSEYNVDKNFKRKMNPNGQFYRINERLYEFPSIAAGLLKYKKHEWIIIAFEKNKKILFCWVNKGFDKYCVSPCLSVDDLIDITQKESYVSIMIFHNHPNSNPNYFDCSKPSLQDIKSAKEFAQKLKKNGINLLEFVCERGVHYQYFAEYSDSFLPFSKFLNEVRNQNGRSKFNNLLLHLESFFS